jgi:hypothetical protein
VKETYEDGWHVFRHADGNEICRALWMGRSYLVVMEDGSTEGAEGSGDVVSLARTGARARTRARYTGARARPPARK